MDILPSLFANMEKYVSSEDRVLVIQAAHFAEQCHEGFFRLDGSPYILHPIAVATILSEWQAPPEILAAALLHDIFKRQYSQEPLKEVLEAAFSPSMLSLIQDVASLGKLGPSLTQREVYIGPEQMYVEQEHLADMRGSQKFYWATTLLQRNPMAVVVKLADQLHNLQEREKLPSSVRQETDERFAAIILNIFAPLADRLGMQRVKERLEDGAFYLYNRDQYVSIDASLHETLVDISIDDSIDLLKHILQKRGIEAKIFWRLKHRYAIFRQKLASATKEVTTADMMYIVVVVPSIEDCYQTLGAVYSKWRPIGRVYDNIADPKPNGYRALHTRAFEPTLGPITVIIRTQAMHLVAEQGITAQWRGVDAELLPKIDPLPERPDGHIMAITPKGEIKYLPKDSTPIDFAYAVNEEMGHRCMQVWVNGNQIPLEMPLEDGAVVDVIASRGITGPNREWLQYVKTRTAKEAIENWTRGPKYVELTIEGTERVGLLKDVLECISSKGINILYTHCEVVLDKASFHLVLHIVGQATFDDLEKEVRSIPQITRLQLKTTESMPRMPLRTTASHEVALSSPPVNGTPSPYALAPVVGHDFKGREREVDQIVNRLRGRERDNPLLIWGQQRIGKTSLLWHLEKDVLQNEKYLIVNVTLHAVLGQPLGYFLHRITLEIEQKVQREELKAPDVQLIRQDPIFHFQEFIDHLEHVIGPQRILIILDEFQGIGTLKEENTTRQDVFTFFRSLLQREVTVNFLFCGGGIHEQLLAQSGLNSLLSVVDPIRVGVLEQEDAKALIVEIDASLQPALHYEEEAIKKLLAITDCHPCYLKSLCKELYITRISQKISLADVERVIDQMMDWRPKLEGVFQHFWEMGLQNPNLAAKNKRILSTIANKADSSGWIPFDQLVQWLRPYLTEEELSQSLTNLTSYESIDMMHTCYRVHLPLLALWFKRTYA